MEQIIENCEINEKMARKRKMHNIYVARYVASHREEHNEYQRIKQREYYLKNKEKKHAYYLSKKVAKTPKL